MERPSHSPAAAAKAAAFHPDVVEAVSRAIREHEVVVVGMGWNPHVARARRALDAAGVQHHDIDFGNYASQWKQRLAIKMWSGWPTVPQVFHRGTRVGGADETEAAVRDGLFAR